MRRSAWPIISFLWLPALLIVIPGLSGVAEAQRTPTISNPTPLSNPTAYWTPATMAAAVPMDLVRPGAPTPASAPASLAPGPPGGAGGSLPGEEVNVGPGLRPELSGTGPTPADGSYPGPHDTYEYGPRYRTYPISTVGKLFFTQPGVGNFVCSAAVTTGGAPRNIIWTAGHCVANGGASTFYTNWLFCPSYDSSQGGVNPAVGCWSWSSASTNTDSFNNGRLTRDYAVVGLQSTGTVWATDVANVTGGLGFAWNQARDQHWHHYGYPAAAPYTGGKIIATTTEHRFDDSPDGIFVFPYTNSWGSDQTGGSSGSSLIKAFSYVGGGNWINSNVSYGYVGQPGELYGPYFDTTTCNFWKSTTAWPGTC